MAADRQVTLELLFRLAGNSGAPAAAINATDAAAKTLRATLQGVTAEAYRAAQAMRGMRMPAGGGGRAGGGTAGGGGGGVGGGGPIVPYIPPLGGWGGPSWSRGVVPPPSIVQTIPPPTWGQRAGAFGGRMWGGVKAAQPYVQGLMSGGIATGLAMIPEVGPVLSTAYSVISKWTMDTVNLVKNWGGKLFNLLAAPFRQLHDFLFRFMRWQLTWALIGLGAATIALTKSALSGFAEYELLVTKAVTTTGLLGAAAAKAKKEFMEMGLAMSMRSMLSGEDIAKQMYWLTSAGLKVQEAKQVLPGVIALAQATQADPAATSALVVSAMRAFHLEADQTKRVVNLLAADIGTTLLTLETLATALPYVGASAYQAGLSLETTAAAIGVLSDNGLKASRMGTGLRGMFAALMNPTREAEDILRRFGLSAKDVNIQARGLYPVLNALVPILAARDERGEPIGQRLISKMFGRRTTEAVNILVSQRDRLRETEDAITGTNRAWQMQEQILGTLAGQWAMLKNTGGALLKQFGEGLGYALKPWAVYLRDMGESLFFKDKAKDLGTRLGQWISEQLTKVQKWIVSGDAKKWWDGLVTGARAFWSAVTWAWGKTLDLIGVLKTLNTPENRAFFKSMGDWLLQLANVGFAKGLKIIEDFAKATPNALSKILEFIWMLIPAATAYLKVWILIAAAKARAAGSAMIMAGAGILGARLTPAGLAAVSAIFGGPKQAFKTGASLVNAGIATQLGAIAFQKEGLGLMAQVDKWYAEHPVPPKLGNAIVSAHAEGGKQVADSIRGAFAQVTGTTGTGAFAGSVASGAVHKGVGAGHWSYQYLKGRSGAFKKVWVPDQAEGYANIMRDPRWVRRSRFVDPARRAYPGELSRWGIEHPSPEGPQGEWSAPYLEERYGQPQLPYANPRTLGREGAEGNLLRDVGRGLIGEMQRKEIHITVDPGHHLRMKYDQSGKMEKTSNGVKINVGGYISKFR